MMGGTGKTFAHAEPRKFFRIQNCRNTMENQVHSQPRKPESLPPRRRAEVKTLACEVGSQCLQYEALSGVVTHQ
jgi:hypothetical protein